MCALRRAGQPGTDPNTQPKKQQEKVKAANRKGTGGCNSRFKSMESAGDENANVRVDTSKNRKDPREIILID